MKIREFLHQLGRALLRDTPAFNPAVRDRDYEQRANDQVQQAIHEAYTRLGPPPGWEPNDDSI